MTVKTYDARCYDLAALFLSDHPHLDTTNRVEALAREIQMVIEDFLEGTMNDYEPPETGDAWSGGFADNH